MSGCGASFANSSLNEKDAFRSVTKAICTGFFKSSGPSGFSGSIASFFFSCLDAMAAAFLPASSFLRRLIASTPLCSSTDATSLLANFSCVLSCRGCVNCVLRAALFALLDLLLIPFAILRTNLDQKAAPLLNPPADGVFSLRPNKSRKKQITASWSVGESEMQARQESMWEFDVGSKRYLCALTEEEQQTVFEVDEWFTTHHPSHEERGAELEKDNDYEEPEEQEEEEEKMDVVSKPSVLLKSAAVRCVARVDDDGDEEEDDEPVTSTAAKENTAVSGRVGVNANTARKPGSGPQAVLPKKRPADNRAKPATASTIAAKSSQLKKKKVDDDLMSEAELKALLKKHNKKLAPKATYVAPLHSVRDVRGWEIKSGKSWQNLSVDEKDAANQEIELTKRR